MTSAGRAGPPSSSSRASMRHEIASPNSQMPPFGGHSNAIRGRVLPAMIGTVATALCPPSPVTVSLASWRHKDFRGATRVVRTLVERLLARELPPRFLLNVNIPPVGPDEIAGYRLTRLGSRVYNDAIIKKTDPRGRDYYWIGGAEPTWNTTPESDFGAVEERFVSMTPLRLDLTDQDGFGFLTGLEVR